MPSSIAVCVYGGVIIWALCRHSKDAGSSSKALWVPLIWIMINSSRPLAYWFGTGTKGAEALDFAEGSAVDRNAYLCLMAIGIVILLRRRVDWRELFTNMRWLWLLYAYFLVSVLWSPYIFVAFKRWFKDVGDVIMILIILTDKDPLQAIRGIFLRCAYLLIPLSVLFIKYYPAIGRYENPWIYTQFYCGVTANKNSLGLLAALSGMFLLWEIVDIYKIADRWKRLGAWRAFRGALPDVLVLVMCLWILRLAGSATALSCFALGAAIFFCARLRVVRANLGRVGLCLFGVSFVMLMITVSPFFRQMVTGIVGRDATLTERTAIWDKAIELGTNPLIGSGFSSVWLTPKGAALVTGWGGLAHSHNGYLETYLNGGWIGICLLLGVLFMAGQNATTHLRAGTVVGYLFMALFLTGAFYNYSEVTFFRSNTMGLVLWLLAVPYGLLATEALSIDEEIAANSDQHFNQHGTEPVGRFEYHGA